MADGQVMQAGTGVTVRGPVAVATVHGWGLGVSYMYVLVQMCVCLYVWLKFRTHMCCVCQLWLWWSYHIPCSGSPPLPLAEMFTMAINGLWVR